MVSGSGAEKSWTRVSQTNSAITKLRSTFCKADGRLVVSRFILLWSGDVKERLHKSHKYLVIRMCRTLESGAHTEKCGVRVEKEMEDAGEASLWQTQENTLSARDLRNRSQRRRRPLRSAGILNVDRKPERFVESTQ